MDEYGMGVPADQPPENAQQWDGAPLYQPPQAPRPPRRRSLRRWLVIGGASAALLLALGVGVGIGASALTAHATSLSGIQATLASLNSKNANGGPHGGPGFGPGRGGDLTVSSLSGQTITAKRPDGASVTVKVSSSTQYTRAGKTVSLSAITAGEAIDVMGTRNSDGSISATRVDIVLPHAGGQVTSMSGSTITVKNPQGTVTIHTSASTTVQRADQSASLSDIAVGAQIHAEGTKNSDGSLNADAITIVLPRAGGQIKSISGSTITVTNPHGSTTMTIKVTASTKYVTVTLGSNGPTQASSSFSALKAGAFINAEGTKNSDGSLTAEVVTIMPNAPSGKVGPGGPMGGPGGNDGDGPHNGAPPAATTSN